MIEAGVPKMHCAACVICDVKVSVDDENMERIKDMWNHNEKLYVLTNNTQNIYQDVFR